MAVIKESEQAARVRAAVDRLHAAQLAALDDRPATGWDAFGAERHLLDQVGEIGSLLVRLVQTDAEGVDLRLRLVSLAVRSANTLAELVSLALEMEEEEPGLAHAGQGLAPLVEDSTEGGGRSAGRASANPTSMRAVTDGHHLLVDQLRRLLQNAKRRESWRSARPGELWRHLLLQASELFPLVAAQELGALSESQERELRRLTADAANYVAFIRCHPRLPTV